MQVNSSCATVRSLTSSLRAGLEQSSRRGKNRVVPPVVCICVLQAALRRGHRFSKDGQRCTRCEWGRGVAMRHKVAHAQLCHYRMSSVQSACRSNDSSPDLGERTVLDQVQLVICGSREVIRWKAGSKSSERERFTVRDYALRDSRRVLVLRLQSKDHSNV